jgi:RNA polymerase sigma-70 factor (ECF subfamily)
VSQSPLELQELIRGTARRDKAAFARLYAQTAPQLFGIALRIVRRREIAEEILQEAFVAAWERAADFDPQRGSAMSWLVSIVRHGAIDQLRRQAARPGRISVTDPEELLARIAGPDRADRGAEMRGLQRCLDELDDMPRRSVLLAYVYGLTRDELAEQLAVPVGTIKSWVRRSLERLKRCLERCGTPTLSCVIVSRPNTCSARCQSGRAAAPSLMSQASPLRPHKTPNSKP